MTIAQIVTASASLKSYVAKNYALPSSVKVGSYSVSQAQFSYLMAMAIKYIKAGKKTTTKIKIISVSLKTTSLSVKYTAKSSAYVSLAKNVASYCSSNKETPTYGKIGSKKIDYRSYTYGFAKILAFYKSNKCLPSSCLFTSAAFKKPAKYVTISQIVTASASLKSYVLSKKALPSSVKVGSYSVSSAQFSYLMAAAIKNLKAGKKTSTKIKIISVALKTTTYTVKYTAKSSAYVSLAKSVVSYCSSNKKTPTYRTVNSKKIDYRSYTYGFANILAYYKSKKRLPSSCLFESGVFKSTTPSTTITLNDILTAANTLNSHVSTDKGVPKTITVKGTTYDTPQFLYMMAMAIKNINAGKTSATYSVKKVTVNKDLDGDWISVSVSKSDYVTVAGNVANYIDNNGRAPNYATLPSNSKKANYNVYTAAFASILTQYKNNKVLPSSQSFSNLILESYDISDKLSSKNIKDLTFYLTTDNIDSDKDSSMLNSIKSTLTSLGAGVEIVGIGPDKHNDAYKSGCTGSNSVLLCCFGGVDVGCIEEWTGDLGTWFPEAYKGANILSVFYLDPYGCAANLHDPISPAWDADYGTTLDDSAAYMSENGISYIQTGTVARVCSILSALFG